MVYSSKMSVRIINCIVAFLLWSSAFCQHGGGVEKFSLEQKHNALAAQNFVRIGYDASNIANLKRQMAAWEAVVKEDSENEYYWFNYYMTVRMYCQQTSGGVVTTAKKPILNEIAKNMGLNIKKKAAQSFEQLMVSYFESNNYDTAVGFLLEAAKMNPENPFIIPEMAKYYAFSGISADKNPWLHKIPEIGDKTALYQYSKALLGTLPNDALLITNGEYDTYAIWKALQVTDKKIRVISLRMIENIGYRLLLAQSGLDVPSSPSSQKSLFLTNLFYVFGSGFKMYVSLTVPPDTLKQLNRALYNTGFAYQYSETPIENLEVLYQNLVNNDIVGVIPSYNNEIFKNLMPGYILLHRAAFDETKRNKIQLKAKEVAEKAGFWGEFKKFF